MMTKREEEAAGILERGLKPPPVATSNGWVSLSQIRKLRSAMRRALGKLRRDGRPPASAIGRRPAARRRTAHEKCRDACAREMRRLRAPYPPPARVEIAVRSLDAFPGGEAGRYEASNMYGHVWTGRACCKWRARARAAKALAARKK